MREGGTTEKQIDTYACRNKFLKAGLALSDLRLAHLQKRGLRDVPLSGNESALSIGLGGGKVLSVLLNALPGGHVTGQDTSPASVDASYTKNQEAIEEGRLDVYQGGADILPFGKNAFDLVSAVDAVYFWSDVKETLLEILRVMKPGGTLVIANGNHGWGLFDPIYEAVIPSFKACSREDLLLLLEETGFTDIEAETCVCGVFITAKKPEAPITGAARLLKNKKSAVAGMALAAAVTAIAAAIVLKKE